MPRRWRQHEVTKAQITNEATGEIISGTITGLVPQQQRRSKARREIKFVMIDIEAMPKLAMSKGEWKLFWAVVKYTDRERGESRVQTSELADAIGWNGPNTSRAISRLCKRGILIKERVGVLRVNPQLMTRKSVDKWEADMASAPAIDWEGEDE